MKRATSSGRDSTKVALLAGPARHLGRRAASCDRFRRRSLHVDPCRSPKRIKCEHRLRGDLDCNMLLSRSDSSPESVPPSHGPKSPDEATKLNVEAMQPFEAQSSQRTSPRPVIVPLGSSARRTSHLTAQEQAVQDGVVASNESSTSSRARHPRKSARELIRGILSSADVSASSNFKLIKHSLLAARALGGKAWNPGSVASGHKQ